MERKELIEENLDDMSEIILNSPDENERYQYIQGMILENEEAKEVERSLLAETAKISTSGVEKIDVDPS